MKCEMSACFDEHGNKKVGCDAEATQVVHGRLMKWHVCDKHYNELVAFLGRIRSEIDPEGYS